MQHSLTAQAKLIPVKTRQDLLLNMQETELHIHLQSLFARMEPDYRVEVTHGTEELGKDLVIIKTDKFEKVVIGVVVKRGHIRAKTLGDVDALTQRVDAALAKPTKKMAEIESQIAQAFANPATLKSSLNNLPVTEVFVVIAGEVSATGRTRIQNERPGKTGKTNLFDLQWLVEHFTESYPEVFFDPHAISYVQQAIKRLETQYYYKNSKLAFCDYYIEPIISKDLLPSFSTTDEENVELFLTNKKMPCHEAFGALNAHSRIILVGEPGSGKTNTLAKLAYDQLHKASEICTRGTGKTPTAIIPIPLFLHAKEFIAAMSAEEALLKIGISGNIAKRFSIASVFVDALDEVPTNAREGVLANARALADTTNAPLVITARKIDIIQFQAKDYIKYELLPFEISQALKLFSKILKDKKTLASLKEGLERFKAKVPMLPISLLFLIELAEQYREVPASATELYDRYFDIALGKHDKEKGIEVLFEYQLKKSFYAELAHECFYKNNRLEITREEYSAFLKAYCDDHNIADSGVFTSDLERGALLEAKEAVFFRHRSYLDYFLGLYLYNKRDEYENINEHITNLYFNDLWADSVFYYWGLKREINGKALDRILSYPKEGLRYDVNKFIVGQLLQAAWNSRRQDKEAGIRNAAPYGMKVAQRIREVFGKGKGRIPKVWADILCLKLAEYSFRSTFLSKEVESVLSVVLKESSKESFFLGMQLYWAIRELLNSDRRTEYIERLNAIGIGLKDASFEESTRALIMMKVLNHENRSMIHEIERKLKRLMDGSPKEFKEIAIIHKGVRGSRKR